VIVQPSAGSGGREDWILTRGTPYSLALQRSTFCSLVLTKVTFQKTLPTNYTEEEELGDGAFGVVFKCWDNDRHTEFVAKRITLRREMV
jgi:hypothetical protein